MKKEPSLISRLIECNLGTGSDYPSDECTELIEEAFHEYQTEDLSELLVNESSGNDLSKISQILNIAIWCGNDNGSSSTKTQLDWLLNSDNPDKIYLALTSETIHPLTEKLKNRIVSISNKYPELKGLCNKYTER